MEKKNCKRVPKSTYLFVLVFIFNLISIFLSYESVLAFIARCIGALLRSLDDLVKALFVFELIIDFFDLSLRQHLYLVVVGGVIKLL